jgi:hypothetical protein
VEIVRLPPLVLHIVHERSGGVKGPNVIPLQRPSAYLPAQDNEGPTIAVILHMPRAAAISGLRSFALSELVEIPTDNDIELGVPACFDIDVLGERIKSKHFKDEISARRVRAINCPLHTRIALINGRCEAHEDGFVIFSNRAVLILEAMRDSA